MLYFLIAAGILAVDILTKIWAKNSLAGNDSIRVIEDVFHLTYVENRGAAFGILQNAWVFFIIIAAVLAVVVVFLLRMYKQRHPLLKTGLSFLCAGALGNTIDRIMQGYVVDFFNLTCIDFPVFNVADIFVCVGAGLLAVFFVFFDSKKDEKKEKDKVAEKSEAKADEEDSTSGKADEKKKKCDIDTEKEDHVSEGNEAEDDN